MADKKKNEKSRKQPTGKKRALKDLPADAKGDDVKGGPTAVEIRHG